MANIWEVRTAANRYLCVQQNDLRYFADRFKSVPMSEGWTAPSFELLNKSKKVADFTSWQIGSRTFLVSRRAKDAIHEICGDDVEFLPFATIKRTELFAINVLRKLAVVDWAARPADANLTCGPYALKRDLGPLPPLFKDSSAVSTTFASDEIGAIAVDRGFTGLQLADPRKNLGRMIVHGHSINEYPGL
jgi:hypothetical protein